MTPRVLYVAADPALTLDQQGGAGTHMRGTVEALEQEGLAVETLVGAPAALASAPTIAQRPAPRMRRVTPRPARLLAGEARLIAHARACRRTAPTEFDCVYERSAYLVDVGRPLALRHGVPYLVETDGMLVAARTAAYGTVFRRHADTIERRKVAAADAVVVMSRASADSIAARYEIPRARLLVKGLGVERSLVARPPVAEPSVDIGFAGTFQPYHGLDVLVDAVRLLGNRSALLVGDGPRRPLIEEATDALPVELPGLLEREETLRRLAACRVLVVPESSETLYPVKLLEYAALHRPIVCPARAAFDEFERDGEPVFHRFRPGDAADLARALDEALAAGVDERVERLAELVAAEYTWDSVGARLAARIRALVRM